MKTIARQEKTMQLNFVLSWIDQTSYAKKYFFRSKQNTP